MIREIEEVVQRVCIEFAPDPRLAVYEIDVRAEPGSVRIVGATSEPAAAEALRSRIGAMDLDIEVRYEVQRLPVDEDGFKAHGVVRSPAAPMLAGPMISESPVSQVVLGQRLLVLDEHFRWLRCRSADGYVGWVHRGYVQRMEEIEARQWEMGAVAPLHISLGVEILSDEGEVSHRVPWGGRVAVKDGRGFVPDGGSGPIRGETVAMAELESRFPLSGESIVREAAGWLGAPYFWGGIIPGGVDCSGLVQTLYRVHGRLLPRDSDLQALEGEGIDPGEEFEALEPGDLVFFAEDGQRVSHVAISEGGPNIIHSALGNGGVRRNDLLGRRGIETELRSLFVCARRIIAKER